MNTANATKERTIRLESHRRRNNLILCNIPEVRRTRIQCQERNSDIYLLGIKRRSGRRKTNDIPIEQALRLRKIKEDNKPLPVIAKLAFTRIRSVCYQSAFSGRNKLCNGISRDFPREIVEIRRGLVKPLLPLTECKKCI